MKRGVLMILWGGLPIYLRQAEANARIVRGLGLDCALALYDPELADPALAVLDDTAFTQVIRPPPLEESPSLLTNLRMESLSPFDATLFLDLDAVPQGGPGSLDFGFQQAERWGIALTISPDSYCPHYPEVSLDIPRYNLGAVFFARCPQVAKVFEDALAYGLAHAADTTNCEPAFARSVHVNGFCPYVLPHTWNYRNIGMPAMYGPVKIFHSRTGPPPGLDKYNAGHGEFHWNNRLQNTGITPIPYWGV